MNRLLVASADLAEERPLLSRENGKHLKVLRPVPGEEFGQEGVCPKTATSLAS